MGMVVDPALLRKVVAEWRGATNEGLIFNDQHKFLVKQMRINPSGLAVSSEIRNIPWPRRTFCFVDWLTHVIERLCEISNGAADAVIKRFWAGQAFNDCLLVAFEVGLDALQVGDGFVEAGELLFEFGDDLILPFETRQNDWEVRKLRLAY
jgi:hypothetical protein